MRLISCHIENFGKLSGESFDFENGLNRIYSPNGSGKSTLAAFLKVMFYGFFNDKSRDDYVNERKRFRPWQGGTYGGQITFEVSGKKYTASRVFGNREKDDVFELRDAEQNTVSGDFTEKLGEELFKIDAESFVRTVFISQNDCMTETTDGINAKLGNLADNTDDINNYGKADEKLHDLLNRMSPKRATGLLHKMNSELSELAVKVNGRTALEKSLMEITVKRNGRAEARAELDARRQELLVQQSKISLLKDAQAKHEIYKALCKALEDRQKEYLEAVKDMPGELPDDDEISDMISECRRIYGLESEAKLTELSESERDRLVLLEEQFARGAPDDRELDRQIGLCVECAECEHGLAVKRAKLEAVGRENPPDIAVRKHTKAWTVMFIAGLVLGVLGIAGVTAGIILKSSLAQIGGVFCCIGIPMLFVSAARSLRAQGRGAVPGGSAEIERLRKEIYAEEDFVDSCQKENVKFLSGCGIESQGRQVLPLLYDLKRQKSDYSELKERRRRHGEAAAAYARLKDTLCVYIRGLSFEPEENMQNQLIAVRDTARNIKRCRELRDNAERSRDAFAAENSIAELEDAAKQNFTKSLENINDELKELDGEREMLYEEIAAYDRELDVLCERIEQINEESGRLDALRQEYADKSSMYNILERTKEFLAKANTSFTARYMEPITRGFEKYCNILENGEAGSYSIDANVKLTASEYGLQRDIRFLSAGYKDLLGICMRMALADAMYSGEKPFLIFDDPFVNLDDDKYKRAADFLKELEKFYQIIYFTCRSEL